MRRFWLSAAVLLAATATARASAQSAPNPKPTLVVFVTVDQMRSDYFQRFDKQFTGGLRRLYDGGAFFSEGYQDHGITETAPGHSVTMSGRFPIHTGIVMNSQGVNDVPNAELIGAPADPGASPIRFQGTTLTDWLKAANSRTRFLSVSRKDRGAILPIGRSRGDIYWWAPSTATFTTSRYYADALPAWVDRFNARHMGQQHAGTEWNLLLPESAYPEPDSVPAENRGKNFMFPHQVSDDSTIAARSAPAYPWMDEMTLALALEGVQQLGLGSAGDRTDVLAVSLSTTDAIGHAYGPDSREMHDQILRLDRYLGVFFDSLFKMRDQRRIVVALTADHGMSPLPAIKSTLYPNHDAKIVSIAPAFRAFRHRLTAAGVDSDAVAMDEAMVVLVKPSAFDKVHMNADSAIASFGADAMQIPGVLRADMMSALAKADTVHDYIARRWLHMVPPNSVVRMIITLTPYSYWAPGNQPTHGSPHNDDAHVPVLFYGEGVQPGKYTDFVRVVDMAPTLAALIGVKPLEKLDGHVLKEAIK
ncbi:MAG: type phosphodiesterase/nucleotide pyrophosphatase [Gemmatimonadetes bacterium]|nr:type phosphodiesterase/nucleotide pyrophosphatase [Gemmatimonadota bacterium]